MINKNIIIAVASLALLLFILNPLFLAGNLGAYASYQDKLISPMEEAQFSKQYCNHVQAHDLDAVKAVLDPKLVNMEFKRKFDEMADIFPNEAPKSMKFISANTNTYNGRATTDLSSEYEFSHKWILCNVILQKQNNGFLVLGFQVLQSTEALEKLTQFSFWGESAKHYAVFITATLLLLFDIYVLALCIKTPIQKRKWLWIVFILLGVGKVEFNWMSGAFYYFGNHGNGFTIDFLKFPVVQFSQMLYQPFIITMTIPLGAIIFLFKRRKWSAE